MNDSQSPLIEITQENRVSLISLNRKQALNALSRQLIAELDKQLDVLAEKEDVHVVVLCSSGATFCAGADIEEMSGITFESAVAEGYIGSSKRLGRFPKPVVVAVEGLALGGGCEMVEMCDIVIASERASFSHPEITLNAMPGAGGTQRLPRIVGKHRAMDMLLCAKQMSALEAKEAGLVSRLVEPGQAERVAMEVANSIAQRPLPLLLRTKACILKSMPSLEESLAIEADSFRECFNEEPFVSAVKTFVQRQRGKRG